MARPLSAEEIQFWKEEFDQYDIDGGGSISVEEFGRVMKASGQHHSDAEIAQIIKEVDLDGDGTINFDEFIAMMTGRTRKPPAGELTPPASASTPTATKMPDLKVKDESEYEEAWKEFYPTLNGSITASQFRQVMGELGEMVTDKEVDELMGSVGGEEKLHYRQFVEFAKRKSGAA